MEQLRKIVLEAPEGMHYTATQGENGELIVRLVPNSSEISCDKAKFFTKITSEDRKKVKDWLAKQKGETGREESFLTRVRDAVKVVDYDYWIANLEPSVKDGKIYYAQDRDVGVGFSGNQWLQMAKKYAPERGSRLSNLDELLIWYALRIVNGLWTLDYVANDSSSAGNYKNAPRSTHSMERTGARICGGFYDGQGNSYKIVIHKDCYALIGGDYLLSGNRETVADFYYHNDPNIIRNYGSGVLVLTK